MSVRSAKVSGGRKAQIRHYAFEFRKLTEQIAAVKNARVYNEITRDYFKGNSEEFLEMKGKNENRIIRLREEYKSRHKEEYKKLQAQRGVVLQNALQYTSYRHFFNIVGNLKK